MDHIRVKEQLKEIESHFKEKLRGTLGPVVERKMIESLTSIYLRSIDNFERLYDHKSSEALLDLLERMEADFSQKFAQDVIHCLEDEIEKGKVKLAYLDAVRRILKSELHHAS